MTAWQKLREGIVATAVMVVTLAAAAALVYGFVKLDDYLQREDEAEQVERPHDPRWNDMRQPGEGLEYEREWP